ncbi:hypothetical protein BK648_07610 [Pseudomonas poae]|uniref:HTH lysR-type domain-containing protein n=1 Tax=Pseudomonas poae TaxID=200451 RepID=A0A423FAR5_9PSED|nr:LysR family transcriptional regulator [Pseudomonas poae]ROM53404.1 hypothetical protein BK648_07610 [Pseudomonas poae]
MNRHNLRCLDLSSLVLLEAVVSEGNVTAVGEKMGLSQSAVSNTLSRLRVTFDDPLLIRVGRCLEPTSRAVLLLEQLSPALDSLANALCDVRAFVAVKSDRTFRVGVSDDVEFSMLPPLLSAIHSEAPMVKLMVEHADGHRLGRLLQDEKISVGICRTTKLPRHSHQMRLRESSLCVISVSTSGLQMNIDEYCARPHVLVSHTSEMRDEVDDALEAIGRKRRVLMAVPRYSALPSILAGTDLIATIPDHAADVMVQSFPLRRHDVPFTTPIGAISVAWLDAQNRDPAEKWLREMIAQHLGTPL